MDGIDLNQPIQYLHSSFRYFKEGEHHIERLCADDVLLMVFEGVLRFSENGEHYELHPGDYHIQRHGSYQAGPLPSDRPKYLYVHFRTIWGAGEDILAKQGKFDYPAFQAEMEALDRLSHEKAPLIAKAGLFYSLLAALRRPRPKDPRAEAIAAFIIKSLPRTPSLEALCKEFHFSKNHILNLFKKSYGLSPIAYANHKKLERAEYLMEVTSLSQEEIADSCGFGDYSHFYKQFLKRNGCAPEKWRHQRRLH